MEEHSKKYNDLAKWYGYKFWDKSKLALAVKASWITPDEYKEITKEEYTV